MLLLKGFKSTSWLLLKQNIKDRLKEKHGNNKACLVSHLVVDFVPLCSV